MAALRSHLGLSGLLALLLSAACSGRVEPPGELTVPHARGPGAQPAQRAPDAPGQQPPTGQAGSSGLEPPDAEQPDATSCTDLGTVGAPLPLRRLTATQVERTVQQVLGAKAALAVTDERLFTYRSNVSTAIDASGARGYLDFAEAAAAGAQLDDCGDDCLGALLDDVAPRLFRRPLEAEQRARYEALFALGEAEGQRWVLEAMLQSPSFLYLDEVVDEEGYLDDYSLAARMALVLWGSNPDRDLLARAESGGLSSPDDVREVAQQMLADPRSAGGLHDFVDQWLELHRLVDGDSRPDLGELGAETLAALREEPVRFFGALLEHGGGIDALLTSSRTVRLDPLAAIYGGDIQSMTADAFELDPARRAGILALPGVMAALAHAGATSPTLRGYAVLANFLCAPPPPPPAGVNVTLPEVGPDASARERLEAHFSDDSCGSCHRSMDGIGFAFESIDWLGRSRDDENGRAVDDASTFFLSGTEISVDGVAEFASALAADPNVAACVAKQWARYATGIPETADAECLLARLGDDIAGAGGLREMMLTFMSSDWFRRGREEEP